MNAIVLLGPPGAGKGTLAESLKDKTNYLHISSGDLLRAAIQAETPLGIEARKFMDKGELVPDAMILGIIREYVAQPGREHLMFDGFPRTLDQAREFDRLIADIDGTLHYVINLSVDEELLVRRLTGRRICRTCGAVYHLINVPPKKHGVCDHDGEPLCQRADDNEETARNRLSVYGKRTAPLISYYREKGLLRDIDASNSPAESCALALKVLQQ